VRHPLALFFDGQSCTETVSRGTCSAGDVAVSFVGAFLPPHARAIFTITVSPVTVIVTAA
jgi:hypothetical protein